MIDKKQTVVRCIFCHMNDSDDSIIIGGYQYCDNGRNNNNNIIDMMAR